MITYYLLDSLSFLIGFKVDDRMMTFEKPDDLVNNESSSLNFLPFPERG